MQEGSAPLEAAPRRVLVTGFHDWQSAAEPGTPLDPHRCVANPSGRLLLGAPHPGGAPPTRFAGPLPHQLRALAAARGLPWSFSFATLPVRWREAETLALAGLDVVVALGLGVYPPEPPTRLLLERGAWNGRSDAPDVSGRRPGRGELGAVLQPGEGPVLAPPRGSPFARRIDAFDGASFGDHATRVIDARPDNAFLCNETHYHLLRAALSSGGPSLVAFIHLASPPTEEAYPILAAAVAELVLGLAAPL